MKEFVVGIICGLINYWVGFYVGYKHSNGNGNVVIQIKLEEEGSEEEGSEEE